MPTCSKCSDADLGRVCPHRQTLLITGEALDNFYAWVREAQQLRSTLTDLIAELRETAAVKPGATGRLLMEMVGSAEARLRDIPTGPMSHNDPIRNILLDLIAVLRDEHRPYLGCAHDCCQECSTCRETWPCETAKEIARAEARLRDVSMSLNKGHRDE